jgi:hypothetical protein
VSPPALLLAAEDVLSVGEALGKVGVGALLGVAVVVLYRRDTKNNADKDAEIAAAREREKSHLADRATWTSTLVGMAQNNEVMADTLREIRTSVEGVQKHLNEHEVRCLERRTGGGDGD